MSTAFIAYYLAFAFPIFLFWVAMQDFVIDSCSNNRHHRVRTLGRVLLVFGVVHLAIGLVGVALIRQARPA